MRQISYTMMLYVMAALVTMMVWSALVPLVGFGPGSFTAGFALSAAGCAIGIIQIIGLAFGLAGVIEIHRGTYEFGPGRQSKILYGIIAIVLGLVVQVVTSVVGAIVALGSSTFLLGVFPGSNAVTVGSSVAFAVLVTILVGLALLLFADGLLTPTGRTRAWIALGLGITATVVIGTASLAVLMGLSSGLAFLFIPLIAGQAISMASVGTWFAVYRGVLERFRRGELRAATPPPMVYPPYYPPYVPGFPAPFVPPQPQPSPQPAAPPPEPAKPGETGEKPPEGG